MRGETDTYLSNFPDYKGTILFVNKEDGNSNTVFRIINDPIKNVEKIKNLVALGYKVRIRTDADTKEAGENDYRRFKKAKGSGAHIITTNYYLTGNFF